MKIKPQKKDNRGFAITEILFSIIVIAVVAGLTVAYFNQQNQNSATNKSDTNTQTNIPTQVTAESGTTDNINQLLQQAIEAEKSFETSSDTSVQGDITGSNSAIYDITGAYDASNL